LLHESQPTRTHSSESNKKKHQRLLAAAEEQAVALEEEQGDICARTYKKPEPPKEDDLHRPLIHHFAQANNVSSPDRQSTLGFNSLAMTMNNNQLANYIDSLKESMA
jgi:hypothetical protein